VNTRVFPEIWVIVFGFLLNFPWEMLQAPFFTGMTEGPFWEITRHCTEATLGDILILLISYWAVAAFTGRKRLWILKPKRQEVIFFLSIGLFITVVFEILATGPLKLWEYKEIMPTYFSIGLAPMLQWIILPLVLLYFFQRFYSSEVKRI
jgi:hypothetical protein